MSSLRITEIFYSIQGETKTVGLPTVFVRLTGCPLRCQYCDTSYAFKGGTVKSIPDILAEIATYKPKYITVTGGEPLAQPDCLILLNQLCDAGYVVSLETSGALDLKAVDPRVVKVMDVKTPGSGESKRNLVDNLKYLLPQDQIKFVICSHEDYLWAKSFIQQHPVVKPCEILFSPSYETLDPAKLAEWVLADKLPVRLQIQLHKYLWGDVPGK